MNENTGCSALRSWEIMERLWRQKREREEPQAKFVFVALLYILRAWSRSFTQATYMHHVFKPD